MPNHLAQHGVDSSSPASPVTRRPGNQTLEVARKDVVADGVVKLRLEEPSGGRLPHWTPGAHIDLVMPTADGGSQVRQYSLCGDRWDASAYEVAVLREPNSKGGSQFIHENLAVGDMLSVGTPRNNFGLAQASRFEFIAGGIGITPIMTMIAAAEKLGIDWHLLYGGRSRRSMAFLGELARYGDRVTVWPQDESGHLPLDFLGKPIEGAKVYCCGPEPLLAAVEFASTNWPGWAVRFERFVAPSQPPPVRTEPFTIELSHSGRTVTVGTDETVLEALDAAGVPVLSSCNEGVCGTCEVGVVGGVPDHRDSLLSDAERAKGDRMFVCVSRSITERLVLDL
ncbi:MULTISPECIES: PDR/VanB family oxidoreductase [Rhodococcus]|uniref:PDR/VanB family oxidoreductase n=1 Tax=Rhodococcus opacus TaxID=37919 RepID=A0AAX3YC09_RHOOP|nr:PDR/VanB family oxidoreductase [Rhodococcus opacus]NHU41914.1 oxidoreductase [Rhodococcus sp. A14]MCZ4586735.1 PDR/VanB family oxidoreductase [Rhodococcus opacus]MDV6243530.1 PDR/VanB family oxidoreductase [Rhodococcus opacus]QZS58756.1 PDR/VanB family oxidoreductase [Rhodococcus opacus]RKM74661.1 oxidoreductase [Rhodococcus opacus]